jgi:hypothetical protein
MTQRPTMILGAQFSPRGAMGAEGPENDILLAAGLQRR